MALYGLEELLRLLRVERLDLMGNDPRRIDQRGGVPNASTMRY